MNSKRLLLIVLSAVASSTLRAQVAAEETLQLEATLPSPWGAPLGAAMPAGTRMRLSPHAMDGPEPLQCPEATHLFMRTPAEGLFEGNLPAPAEQSAKALGLPANVVTQRIACSNGSFDVHRAVDGRAWIGLDNAVLQWKRVGISDSPESIVQTLLVQHFAGDFAFSKATVMAQSKLFTETLLEQLNRWFARVERSDEVPALNGDPYTDSQEPPQSAELGTASVQGDQAELTATYRGMQIAPYPVHFELQRVGGAWRINDLRYRDGQRLSQLLAR